MRRCIDPAWAACIRVQRRNVHRWMNVPQIDASDPPDPFAADGYLLWLLRELLAARLPAERPFATAADWDLYWHIAREIQATPATTARGRLAKVRALWSMRAVLELGDGG
jgi:hypothetical protein